MEEIKVVRVNPLDLPSDVVWIISGEYHITPKEFVVYADNKGNIMYVNENVPEKDIKGFIEVVEFPDYWVDDNDGGCGEFLDHVYDIHGYPAYKALKDGHRWRMEQKAEEEAREKVKIAIPTIEKMIEAGMYNEYMISEATGIGMNIGEKTPKNICSFYTLYPYCLGFLEGMGRLKEEYTPEEIGGTIDYLRAVEEMIWNMDIHEMPRLYGYLKEAYFSDGEEVRAHG